ncbi:hypothetical protein [Streptomyces sp. NPDC051554]|uniref:hypothetical protein n=1 Tax=Streptomyces sp. NPDC051554 TaxID=3365656 RepID=UPI00379F23D2
MRTRRFPVPRPTERDALARVARRPSPEVPGSVLLAFLGAAYAAGDRHGVRLLSRALARRTEAR